MIILFYDFIINKWYENNKIKRFYDRILTIFEVVNWLVDIGLEHHMTKAIFIKWKFHGNSSGIIGHVFYIKNQLGILIVNTNTHHTYFRFTGENTLVGHYCKNFTDPTWILFDFWYSSWMLYYISCFQLFVCPRTSGIVWCKGNNCPCMLSCSVVYVLSCIAWGTFGPITLFICCIGNNCMCMMFCSVVYCMWVFRPPTLLF